jgi:hypothetical protein
LVLVVPEVRIEFVVGAVLPATITGLADAIDALGEGWETHVDVARGGMEYRSIGDPALLNVADAVKVYVTETNVGFAAAVVSLTSTIAGWLKHQLAPLPPNVPERTVPIIGPDGKVLRRVRASDAVEPAVDPGD